MQLITETQKMKTQAFHLLIAQSKELVVFFLGEHGGTMQEQCIQTVTWMMLLIPWGGAIGMIHQDKGMIPTHLDYTRESC